MQKRVQEILVIQDFSVLEEIMSSTGGISSVVSETQSLLRQVSKEMELNQDFSGERIFLVSDSAQTIAKMKDAPHYQKSLDKNRILKDAFTALLIDRVSVVSESPKESLALFLLHFDTVMTRLTHMYQFR